jgi:hypothetical protein
VLSYPRSFSGSKCKFSLIPIAVITPDTSFQRLMKLFHVIMNAYQSRRAARDLNCGVVQSLRSDSAKLIAVNKVMQPFYVPTFSGSMQHSRYFGRHLEIAEGAASCHPAKLDRRPVRLNQVPSQSTLSSLYDAHFILRHVVHGVADASRAIP